MLTNLQSLTILTLDIDIPISNDERATVENMIRHEMLLSQPQHPLVDTLVPLPPQTPTSLSLSAIEQYEQESDDDAGPIIKKGIDMSRYLTPTSDDEVDDGEEKKYFESLYYSSNELSNVELLVQNNRQLEAIHDKHEHDVNVINQQLQQTLDKKRKTGEDINIQRKKRQEDFKPVNDYLNNRWKEGLSGVVDMAVEAANSERKYS